MATTAIRLTVEDLDLVPDERVGDRHELIDGKLLVTPVPLLKHQITSMNAIRALDRHVEEHELGTVFAAPTGVRLSADVLVIPDVCFVSRNRAHQLVTKGIDGPPDLVVEILSPGTRRRDHTIKRSLYARFGVPEYWIVDPDAKTVMVLTLIDGHYEAVPLGEDGTIHSRVLPGLTLTLGQVFARAVAPDTRPALPSSNLAQPPRSPLPAHRERDQR